MWMKVKCSCGHYSDVELLGKDADRQRKKEFFETQGLCKDCYRQYMFNKRTAGCEAIKMDYRNLYKKYFDWCQKGRDSYDPETKTIEVYVPKALAPFAKALMNGTIEDQYEALVHAYNLESTDLYKIMEKMDDEYCAGLKDFIVTKHPELLNKKDDKED